MSGIGLYDPTDPRYASSLWSYGEAPVRSLKLNQWDGNIAAGFALLHQITALLLAGGAGPRLITALDQGDPLRVSASPIPDLTVRIAPGYLIGGNGIAGLTEAATVPEIQPFAVPLALPRIDTIALNAQGTVLLLTGTESASPAAPDAPAGAIPLADVFHRPGETSLLDHDDGVNGYLIDRRPPPLCGQAHRHNTDRSPAESPDGVRTAFSTAEPFTPGSLGVSLNGVLQVPGPAGDYLEQSDGGGYTFAIPPKPGDDIAHGYHVRIA